MIFVGIFVMRHFTCLLFASYFFLFSCQKNTDRQENLIHRQAKKIDSLHRIADSLHNSLSTLVQQNDSLSKQLEYYRFFKDSCIVKGRIGLDYRILGAPYRGEKYPTERQVMSEHEYFKLVILDYKTKKTLQSLIIKPDKSGNFTYTLKLKKNQPYRDILYAKRKNNNKLRNENLHLRKESFRTECKDTMFYNFKIIRFRT